MGVAKSSQELQEIESIKGGLPLETAKFYARIQMGWPTDRK
jgi:hypothetical protein